MSATVNAMVRLLLFPTMATFGAPCLAHDAPAAPKPPGGDVVRFVPHLAGDANRPLKPFGYYKRGALWVTRPINVCWNMDDATFGATQAARDKIRAAIASTWSKVSTAQFAGWGRCGSSIKNGFGIGAGDVDPHTVALGSELDGNLQGMTLNFTYKTWSSGCQTTLDYCDTVIAVHEFGHALGLSHEQNRPDTNRKVCTSDPQGENGDVTVGAWDLASVMNYCNPNWNGNGQLSPTDISTIQNMYGEPAAAKASAIDMSFPHAKVGDCELDAASVTINPDGTATWKAQVKTDHTNTHDVWHASLELLDPVQNSIDTVGEFDSPAMADGHPYYPWQHSFSFPSAIFPEIKGARLHSRC